MDGIVELAAHNVTVEPADKICKAIDSIPLETERDIDINLKSKCDQQNVQKTNQFDSEHPDVILKPTIVESCSGGSCNVSIEREHDSAINLKAINDKDDFQITTKLNSNNSECAILEPIVEIVSSNNDVSLNIKHGSGIDSEISNTQHDKTLSSNINYSENGRMSKNNDLIEMQQCEYCDKNFDCKSKLSQHVTTAHQHVKYYYCSCCDARFNKYADLKNHSDMHLAEPRSFECDYCKKCFTRKDSLKKHIKNTHCFEQVKRFPCSQCWKSFNQPYRLKLHMFVHINEKQFKCQSCGKSFKRPGCLRQHIECVHGTEDNVLLSFQQQRYIDLENRKLSRKTNDDDKPYKCASCQRRFSRADSLEKHNGNPCRRIPDEKPFECAHCGRSFVRMANLKKHNQNTCVRTADDYECAHCLRRFKLKSVLEAHIKLVHLMKYVSKCLPCPHCDKTFTVRTSLTDHIRIHTGAKPYKCDHCKRTFRQRNHLRMHIERIHLSKNVKRFQCPYCEKSFNSRYELENHVRVHTGDKPFKCELCEKCFRQQSNLKRHVKFVHANSDNTMMNGHILT